jgi:hypothetical protein
MPYFPFWLAALYDESSDSIVSQLQILTPPPPGVSGPGAPLPLSELRIPTYVNHARTLLANLAPGVLSAPGEEFIDPGFGPIALPPDLHSIYQILFGSAPDRLGVNYWAWQYMLMLHSTELAEYLTAFDTRLTYLNNDRQSFFDDSIFGVEITPLNGAGQLALTGSAPSALSNGQLSQQWMITVQSSQVQVDQHTPPAKTTLTNYTISNGLSNLQPLTGSPFSFYFPAGVGQQWLVDVTSRPAGSLAGIMDTLDNAGAPLLDSLFALGTPFASLIPFQTFYNL